MQVLTVSDSATTSNMIKSAFAAREIHGIDFLHVRSKSEMLAAAGDQSVVLIDWEGESPDGRAELIYAVKEKLPRVPVLLLCPKANAGSVFAGVRAGAVGVINKPFEPTDVIRSIANTFKAGQRTRPTINVEFINPFIDATHNVFSSMCQVDITRKKLFLKDDYKMLGEVSGVMRLSGAAVGAVVISMSSEFACLVVGKMLGEKPMESLTREVEDAVGEIINMISGQAKASLVKTKYHFTISMPKVVTGPGHEIEHQPGVPNIVVLFEGEGHDFSLQVCLAAADGAAAAGTPPPPAQGK
ncbi:MAG: chemotaxis protein CheX [Planctomycetota bacterium]|jgi:chemotaxis protein CheX|nr:chemotaxis protein CheX [Planctomycetota bacterium]